MRTSLTEESWSNVIILFQIQQAKKEKEPVYSLIAERGMPRRREFVMQVSALIGQNNLTLASHWSK